MTPARPNNWRGNKRCAKCKHVEQLSVLSVRVEGTLSEVNRVAQDKVLRLGRAVLNFHAHTKKEEQKCIERLAKKRLKALKS